MLNVWFVTKKNEDIKLLSFDHSLKLIDKVYNKLEVPFEPKRDNKLLISPLGKIILVKTFWSKGNKFQLIKNIDNLSFSFFHENSWHQSWPVSLNTSNKIPILVKIEFTKKNKEYTWIVDPNITYVL